MSSIKSVSCDGRQERNLAEDEYKTEQSAIRELDHVKDSKLEWLVRPMKHEDIDKCLEIWFQVELTESHLTVASALSTDPEGFYVAELKSNGISVK